VVPPAWLGLIAGLVVLASVAEDTNAFAEVCEVDESRTAIEREVDESRTASEIAERGDIDVTIGTPEHDIG
jgi:hypothetical protein